MAGTASRTGDIGDWLISATAFPNAECITAQDESNYTQMDSRLEDEDERAQGVAPIGPSRACPDAES